MALSWVWSYGTWEGVPEYQIAWDMLAAGKLQAYPLITRRFPLDKIRQAFATADNKREARTVKVLVIPG